MGRIGRKFRGFFKKAVTKAKETKAKYDFMRTVTNPAKMGKVALDAAAGKGLVYPGSKYIGPGNAMNKGKPTNQADANAYQHDLDYDNYIKKGHSPWKVYAGYSDADKRLQKNTDMTTEQGVAVHVGMGVKQLLNKIGLTPTIKDTDIVNGKQQPTTAAPGNPSNNGVQVRVKR